MGPPTRAARRWRRLSAACAARRRRGATKNKTAARVAVSRARAQSPTPSPGGTPRGSAAKRSELFCIISSGNLEHLGAWHPCGLTCSSLPRWCVPFVSFFICLACCLSPTLVTCPRHFLSIPPPGCSVHTTHYQRYIHLSYMSAISRVLRLRAASLRLLPCHAHWLVFNAIRFVGTLENICVTKHPLRSLIFNSIGGRQRRVSRPLLALANIYIFNSRRRRRRPQQQGYGCVSFTSSGRAGARLCRDGGGAVTTVQPLTAPLPGEGP